MNIPIAIGLTINELGKVFQNKPYSACLSV